MIEHLPTGTWDHRAAVAEAAVLGRFVGRYRRVPGTLLARTVAPADANGPVVVDDTHPLHYWWQAHLLDAIIDSAERRLRVQDRPGARRAAMRGHRLLATLWVRNGATLRNHYFDDMAWLVLSVERLAVLDARVGLRTGKLALRLTRRLLTDEVRRSHHSSGGVVWNKDRRFLNAATAGPVALHLARTGHREEAHSLLTWVFSRLFDAERGLVLDGVRITGELVTDVYTYNQGTVLAALLELGAPPDLQRAAQLVQSVDTHLTSASMPGRVLVTHGRGDGGLFTGILARYLALAGLDGRLSLQTRDQAVRLVYDTASSVWRRLDTVRHLFGCDDASADPDPYPHDVELSTQLQAWTIAEAAARLAGERCGNGTCARE